MSHIQATEMMFHLIPLLDQKFVRPLELQFRTLLSPKQANVLSILKEKKATMTELSKEMLVPKQQMTPIIEKLVSQGLVQREYDDSDRRTIHITITAAGLDLVNIVKETTLALLEKKIQNLNDQEVARLINAITEIQKITKKIP